MKDKWILKWQITRFGTSDEYDSFEEAKAVFRNKIAREIEFGNYLDVIVENLETQDNGEKIADFLTKFFGNSLEAEDVVEGKITGEFEASFNADGFAMKESESYRQQVYPTIETNFIFMDDPEKEYRFYFNDPYNCNGIDYDFDGYDYELILRKKTKEDCNGMGRD
ncbi:MAG: hypothetical protein IKU26_06090 [Clostridia bacterium]|nr:hypothetical protein [Clostridia bacterium]